METLEKIKVSVCCFSYNHGKYLRKALDGIIAQDISFPIEVIIGDDCSTDNSQDIIIEYASKYPSLIKTIFQPVNSRGTKNFSDVYEVAKGEYIIALETDDFWTDSQKLQKEVDFLDSHADYNAVSHRCKLVDQNDLSIAKKYPSIKEGVYTYRHFMRGLLPGQTTTLMYRNPKYNNELDMSLHKNNSIIGPGDLKKVFCMLATGKIYTLPQVMSAYRYVTSSGTSFSANNKRNDNYAIEYYKAFQEYARKYNNYSMNLAADVRLLETAIGALRQRSISKLEFKQISSSCKWLPIVYFDAFVNIINRKLRK